MPINELGICRLVLPFQFGQACSAIADFLSVAAGLGGKELLLSRAEVLHDGIAGAGHSGILPDPFRNGGLLRGG